ncbi:MAG TPA: farnesyl diphosphate synthase [Burkholderiaceae bacterium]|nr:farnesyl diphosphate synthase [Burkholderiaceae bacterium]
MNAVTETSSFSTWMQNRVEHIESVLDAMLPRSNTVPSRLHDAMRYAVLGGGKRVRACLVYAAGEAAANSSAGGSAHAVALDHAAAAVELIHAYSLVHDDLPCMDDDDLRRGRPTVHVQYDEATAMLAGDALQPLAFELLAGMPAAPALIIQAVQRLAVAVGSQGMVGGQAIDCDSVGARLSLDALRQMHRMKTGALLEASVLIGGIVAGASSETRQGLSQYASAVGLAFQVVDDILDVVADTATLGKTAGKDAASNKPTYISMLGLDASRTHLHELADTAHQAIRPLGKHADALAGMVDYIVGRDR